MAKTPLIKMAEIFEFMICKAYHRGVMTLSLRMTKSHSHNARFSVAILKKKQVVMYNSHKILDIYIYIYIYK